MCEMASRSTGKPCLQPERWLMEMATSPVLTDAEVRVCQVHGRMLEKRGWRFVRELHPVPGFGRVAP